MQIAILLYDGMTALDVVEFVRAALEAKRARNAATR